MSNARKGKKRGHYYTKTYRHCESCGKRYTMNTYDIHEWRYCTSCCKDGLNHSQRKVISKCELCGTVTETRPYGPKGERVCFPKCYSTE